LLTEEYNIILFNNVVFKRHMKHPHWCAKCVLCAWRYC